MAQIDTNGNVLGSIAYSLSNSKINFGTMAGGRYLITPTADVTSFALSVFPTSQTVVPGSNASFTVIVTGINGFSNTVALGLSGLPDGAVGAFNPPAVSGIRDVGVDGDHRKRHPGGQCHADDYRNERHRHGRNVSRLGRR